MKKILSAALALVCVWFATPAFANCNLTQRIINKTYTGVGSGVSDQAIISDITYKENTPYTITIDVEPSNITFSENGNLLWWAIKYTDNTFDYTGVTSYNYNDGRISVTTNANKTVFSITGLSNHQRWTGGTLKVSNLQIEEGTTATAYTPYNPLCETCDGTVVNYTSATGTVSQSGTPTPDNPIDPVFYQQGNMVLRKVGDYADTYDASTGKITRRVGVKVFNGTEAWTRQQSTYNNKVYYSVLGTLSGAPMSGGNNSELSTVVCNILPHKAGIWYRGEDLENGISGSNGGNGIAVSVVSTYPTVNDWTSYLAQQYAAGTPVTVYYPLATEVVEDWTETSYCSAPIKIATTKYNETAFGPLNTALQNAISVVDSVVSNTITQAASIATLQAQKQTRPADDTCPAYKQCLLVEDENGKPHWYEITDPFRDFVRPIIAKGISPNDTVAFFDAGYTQLEYIRSTQTQYIDTGITGTQDTAIETKFVNMLSDSTTSVLIGDGWNGGTYLLSIVAQTGAPNRIGGLNNSLRDFWRTGQEFVVKMDKTGLYVNNSKTQWGGSVTEFTTTKPLYLLGDPAASNRNSSATLYYMKIYNNGTLVRNFIPAQRNSDGAVGMYDTVSKTFFENKGTGTFTAGPTVANTDVPANPTWMRAWKANAQYNLSAGKVYGTAQCNNLSGTQEHAQKATSAQTASSGWLENGAKCWCKVVGVELDNEYIEAPATASWVFDAVRSSVEDCNKMCVAACSNRVLGEAAFRKALFED